MSDPLEGPGESLRAARQAMEISCREIAEALNLPLRTVEALEANDYERLPGPVFARGYLRAYARLLELDADSVVARYPIGINETENSEVAHVRPWAELVREHPQWVLGGLGALTVVVLIALAVWLWPDSQETARGESQPTRARVESQAPSQPLFGQPSPALNVVVEHTSAVVVLAEQPVVDELGTSLPTEVRSEGVSIVATTDEASELLVAGRITATGNDQLRFEFSDDCWVEIKSTTGARLYSDLSRAGQTLELVGSPPFRILLGYAPGVKMSFNDESVALGPHTRNNVASLVLGQ